VTASGERGLAFIRCPRWPPPWRRLARLLLLVGPAIVLALAGGLGAWWRAAARPDSRLERGREALRQRRWDEAERLALRLEAAGDHDHARLLRGETAFERARLYLDTEQETLAAPYLTRAVTACNQVRDRGELRLQAAALAGKCLLYLHRPAEAERALAFVVHQRPDHAEAHRGLAAIYYDQGALALALSHAQEVARLDSQDGRPHRMMGHLYQQLDRPDQAIEAFGEALRRPLGEQFAEDARVNLAECLVKKGLYADALGVLDGCANRTSARQTGCRAECLHALGRPNQARELLDGALAAEPDAAELLRLRARFYEEERQPEKAAALLQRVLARDRHDYTSRYRLAQIYEGLGRAAEAAEQHRLCRQTRDRLAEMSRLNEEAVSRPWDAEVRRRLAEICQELDQPEQARTWLRAAEACVLSPPAPAATGNR
jgi:tetratricopeptide (TPR) repeat protein